jgi:ArsR family transcriptional regulator, lead/cadmium/zinc/bismuth-responsive transcriptional repressor
MKGRAITVERQCRPKPRLSARPLLSGAQATDLERVFKVLANATRLRLLHALARRSGLSVTDLAETVGMKPQAVSNQLQRLVDKGILANIRSGINIHYRIVDPCIMDLLDQGLCLTEDTWERRSTMSARSRRVTA